MPEKIISILVIDDSREILESTTAGLSLEGFSVVTASTGQEGLRTARERVPDFILLDVHLPDSNGLDVCRELRRDAKLSRVPVILLTGDMTLDVEKGFAAGGDDCIFKPLDISFLITRIRKLLRQNQRILLVEDDREICNILNNIIGRQHYEIEVVNDGKHIMEKLKENRPNLILLDIALQVPPDGIEICEMIKKDPATKDIPVVMLTANESPESIERCFKHGADDYMFKPFTITDLMSKIRKYLIV